MSSSRSVFCSTHGNFHRSIAIHHLTKPWYTDIPSTQSIVYYRICRARKIPLIILITRPNTRLTKKTICFKVPSYNTINSDLDSNISSVFICGLCFEHIFPKETQQTKPSRAYRYERQCLEPTNQIPPGDLPPYTRYIQQSSSVCYCPSTLSSKPAMNATKPLSS